MCCDCYDDWYDDCISYIEPKKDSTMKRNYYVEGGNYHENLDDAVKQASQYSAKRGDEYRVFQAVKLVAPTTPNVVVSDITIASTG